MPWRNSIRTGTHSQPLTFAFTLIQLLVSVVIILILAALFYPALQSMLQRTTATKAMGNLRTVASAWEAYRADNEGRLPQEPYEYDPNIPPDVRKQLGIFALIVPNYLPEIVVCPLKEKYGPNDSDGMWSYGFNFTIAEFQPTVSSIIQPLNRVILYSENRFPRFSSYSHFDRTAYEKERHHNYGINVMFADGSARLLRPEGDHKPQGSQILDKYKDAPSWRNLQHSSANPDGYYFHGHFWGRD